MAKEKKVAAAAAEETRTGTVFGGNLNIRKKPSMKADIIGVLQSGSQIEILEEKDGWYKIQAGYVKAEWVQ